ncbi:MAG: hypothetical protein SNJ59_16825 [Aggregatilineales bacterium]
MAQYGMFVVEPGWKDGAAVALAQEQYVANREALAPGTRVLIYARRPLDAVIAEAVIADPADLGTDAPEEAVFNPLPVDVVATDDPSGTASAPRAGIVVGKMPELREDQVYYIPLRMTRSKAETAHISAKQIADRLGREFIVLDETWIPLSEADYHAITGIW